VLPELGEVAPPQAVSDNAATIAMVATPKQRRISVAVMMIFS
jgi:hypothetical protein